MDHKNRTQHWLNLPLCNVALAATLMTFGAGCGQPDNGDTSTSARELSRDLTTGARGPDVRVVNDYLTSYGYFPNARLAHDFPIWRPLVASAPAANDLFDERTAEALRHLQENSGLSPTGVADQATRDLIGTARCGVPDGIPKLDAADKFARFSNWKQKQTITWRLDLTSVPSDVAANSLADRSTDQIGGMTSAQIAEDQIRRAFSTWASQANITFIDNTGSLQTQDIEIKWADVSDCCAVTSADERYITFNTTDRHSVPPVHITWGASLTILTPAGLDIQTFAAHEIGHALGLAHTAFAARMFPSMNTDRRIFTDDDVVLSSLYDSYVQVPGAAKDIGVGPDGLPWVIGTTPFQAGAADFNISKFNGSGWNQTSEFAAAVRIAVSSSGAPWVVNSGGAIFRRTNCVDWNSTSSSPFSGCFMQVNGAAKDVGTGGDGSVWVIGAGPGDQPAFRFTGDRNNPWSQAAISGARISVGVDGRAWVMKTDGGIWRHSIAAAAGGTWEQLAGRIADIGIGLIGPGTPGVSSGTTGGIAANGYAWSVATASNQHVSLAVYDDQVGAGSDSHSIPTAHGWVTGNQFSDLGPSGPAIAVAVGPNGEPWVINQGNAIFKSTK